MTASFTAIILLVALNAQVRGNVPTVHFKVYEYDDLAECLQQNTDSC